MLNKPKFRNHFHVEIAEPKTVFLLSEKGHFALSGRLYCLIAPFLNGCYTVAEIAEQLQGRATIHEVKYALELLERKGYLTEVDDVSNEVAAFWNLLGIDARVAVQQLQSSQVSVKTCGAISAEPLITALTALGVSSSEKGSFTVVLTDDYLQPELKALNQEALRSNRSWMLAKPIGSVLWLGPIFHAETGCWECLADRLRHNREIESSLQEQKGISTPFPISRASLPSTLQTGCNLIATEIAKWLVSPTHQLEGTLLTFDLSTFDLQHHTLVKRPQCVCCGNRTPEPQPIWLVSQPKINQGSSVSSAEASFQRYQHHISPITGIVRSLVKPTVSELIQVYAVDHIAPRAGNELRHIREAVRPRSFGKGRTDIQAKMSGLGEAIERYSGMFTGNEIRVKGSYAQLHDAIHPATFTYYSEAQYRDRQQWNQQHHPIQWVPAPFDETREIEWTPVWSLTAQTFKYLPTAYCYYGYPIAYEDCFCWADTNGTAAGRTKEAAIVQAFLELVERDAVALWWYNRIHRPGVDHVIDDPYLSELKRCYTASGREFWVLDITSDLKIPTFAAISRRIDRQPEDILFGFGSDFDPQTAIIRAVTEMNQMVFLSNAGNPQGRAQFSRPDMQAWCETATLENQPYLAPDPHATINFHTDCERYQSTDFKDDVLTCMRIAAEHNWEMLVLDQTQPDIGLSVVKVVVPGLRHFWAQLAPGRLYDAPVQLGWLKEPLTEAQLNPIPMFL